MCEAIGTICFAILYQSLIPLHTHALISVYASRLSKFHHSDCLSPDFLSGLLEQNYSQKYYNKYNTGVANNVRGFYVWVRGQVYEKYLAFANLKFLHTNNTSSLKLLQGLRMRI